MNMTAIKFVPVRKRNKGTEILDTVPAYIFRQADKLLSANPRAFREMKQALQEFFFGTDVPEDRFWQYSCGLVNMHPELEKHYELYKAAVYIIGSAWPEHEGNIVLPIEGFDKEQAEARKRFLAFLIPRLTVTNYKRRKATYLAMNPEHVTFVP